jgi:hypothetical protein
VRAQGQVGFQKAFEFDKRLVVKDNEVDIFQLDAACVQAIADRVFRIAGVELLARETLFLRGGNDAAIFDQRGCTIVVKGGNTENAHPPPLKNRVDEWCYGRAFGQNDQPAKEGHDDEHRQQPKLFPRT